MKLRSSHPENIFLFTLLISTHVHTFVTLHDCGLQDTDLTKAFEKMFLENTTRKAKRWYWLATDSRRTSFQKRSGIFTRDIQCHFFFLLTNLHLLISMDAPQQHTSRFFTWWLGRTNHKTTEIKTDYPGNSFT